MAQLTPESGSSLGGPFFAVMRHSARLDMLGDGFEPPLPWDDKVERPWDCPIWDFELPARTAEALAPCGITVVYSSPFRRCLQTAGVVAASLGVRAVTVHAGVGEVMEAARSCTDEAAAAAQIDSGGKAYLLPKAACADLVRSASGGAAELAVPFFAPPDVPPWDETRAESVQRLSGVLASLYAAHRAKGGSVVVVTHGDALAAAAEAICGGEVVLYEVAFCGAAVFDADGRLTSLRHGISALEVSECSKWPSAFGGS